MAVLRGLIGDVKKIFVNFKEHIRTVNIDLEIKEKNYWLFFYLKNIVG